jgi:endonuclease/exonuclease/phosphatase (EEP) superfamily protein YafD
MLLLSKYPFIQADTFNIADTPNIEAHIEFDNDHIVRILASYLKPPFTDKALQEQQAYLKNLSQFSKKEPNRTISLGNFNCVPWSNEVSDFKTNSHLSDSRLGLMLSYPSDLKTMLRVPLEYIFYSKDIRCTNFHAFNNAQNEYLGVVGTYQLCPLK